VSGPVEDHDFGLGTIRQVHVGVAAETAQAWPTHTLREALLALTARCVLAVLPESHAAHQDLQDLYQQGAAHLPR
jgi:hypothetical protein